MSYPFAVVKSGDTPDARALMSFLAGAAGARGVRAARLQGRIALDLSPDEWEAVRLTLDVAARAVGLGLPLAVLTAWLLARYRFPGRPVAQRAGAPAAGAASSRYRLAAADCLRRPRPDRRAAV